MKILLIDNAGLVCKNNRFFCVDGTGKFATELVELGAEVTMYGQLVSMESSVSVFDIEKHGIKTAGLWRRKNKLVNYIGLYLNAIKYIRESDFVYIFYPNAFRFLAFICPSFGTKYGLYVRGEKKLEDSISKRIYKRASVVLSVSPKFTEMVNNVVGSSIAETIRPMLTYDDNDIVRDRTYKMRGRIELLLLSRIQKEKGLLELLNAVSVLKSEGFDSIHLTIAGDGDFLEQAKFESKRLELDNDIEFTGGIYDEVIKATIYKKADIYILPTYHEGFPRTLYEAMIFGTPIVTTFVGGIPALMKENENCLRIEPKSVDSIVNALKYAINHYEEMGKMANKATGLVATIVDRNRPSHAHQLFDIIKDYGK